MGLKQNVTLERNGGDLTVEVLVTFQQPAGIEVALYGKDRRKEKVVGDGVTLDLIPDIFEVAKSSKVGSLDGKFLGVFVAITSFSAGPSEPVTVVSTLRQGNVPLPSGTATASGSVMNGGGGVVIVYEMAVP
jgi:hypothetical protein